ncbi:MAG: sporulation protein [Clostridia bacterium]|nr:sporulation protein [Clostridia bacterium]
METRRDGRGHTLMIEGRSRAVISGVEELGSFSEETVAVFTADGLLTLEGDGLHIDRLNLEEGQMIVSGAVFGALYEEAEPPRMGLFARLRKR